MLLAASIPSAKGVIKVLVRKTPSTGAVLASQPVGGGLEVQPAKVVIVPPGVTFRIRKFCSSAMYIFPEESDTTPTGLKREALVAVTLPSPENPAFPFPATTVATPDATLTTIWWSKSQM